MNQPITVEVHSVEPKSGTNGTYYQWRFREQIRSSNPNDNLALARYYVGFTSMSTHPSSKLYAWLKALNAIQGDSVETDALVGLHCRVELESTNNRTKVKNVLPFETKSSEVPEGSTILVHTPSNEEYVYVSPGPGPGFIHVRKLADIGTSRDEVTVEEEKDFVRKLFSKTWSSRGYDGSVDETNDMPF